MSLDSLLAPLPRIALLDGATPVQRLHGVERALGDEHGVALFAKRDDLGLLGGGGNKLRKLEFLAAEAIAHGADTLIAIGGLQSNFARLTAAVAARLGLACELVLAPMVPRQDSHYLHNGNVLLDYLFGARVHVLEAGADLLGFAQARAQALRAEDRRGHVLTTGGSTPTGCAGYVAAMAEIQQQAHANGQQWDSIVVASGSAGTHAGLVAGCRLLGLPTQCIRAHAVDVARAETADNTRDKANATLQWLGAEAGLQTDDLNISDAQLGAGYGMPTPAMQAAVALMARSEGLLLDPVYSGKAFAGLLEDVRSGHYRPGSKVLFIMTGGSPGLFGYAPA